MRSVSRPSRRDKRLPRGSRRARGNRGFTLLLSCHERADKDGNPLIADNAHVRLGAAAVNDGAQILRRAYSYNDGVSITAERWPPWCQGMLYDAGLFFVAYQRDPRAGFIKIYGAMSKLDALSQFTTHTGGGLFACPAGVREGEFAGQRLF